MVNHLVLIYLFIGLLVGLTYGEQEPALLIATFGHSGQLNPLLTLARELSERNVSFYFATSLDKKHMVEQIKGASFVSIGEMTEVPLEGAEHLTQHSNVRSPATFLELMDLIITDDMYKNVFIHLNDFVKEHRPTMMVIDAATFAAFDVAKINKIPYIVNVPYGGSSVSTLDLFSPVPAIGTGFPLEMTPLQWIQNVIYKLEFFSHFATSQNLKRWFTVKKELGVTDVYDIDARNSPYEVAFIINSILGLDYTGPLVPNDIKFYGAMIRDKDQLPPEGDLLNWLDEAPNVIYVSLGTVARLTKAQIRELLEGLISPEVGNIRVLWKMPKDRLELVPIKNLEKKFKTKFRFEEWVPSQISVLGHPSVKMFISHGGGNGYHEGIYAGKPQLVLPMWLDCYDYAQRVVDLHIGRTIYSAPNFTAKEITENTKEILSNITYTTEAKYWSMRLHTYGGPSSYADYVLSCLPRPLSCKVQYADSMHYPVLVFKFAAPIFAWAIFKKLFNLVFRCFRKSPSSSNKRKQE